MNFTAYTGLAAGSELVGNHKKSMFLWAGRSLAMAEQFQDGEIRKLEISLNRPLVVSDETRTEIYGEISHAEIAMNAFLLEEFDGVVFLDTADGMEVSDVYVVFPDGGLVDHAVTVTGGLIYNEDADDWESYGNF